MANHLFVQENIKKEEQKLFIYQRQIAGVQSFSASYNAPVIPLRYLGMDSGICVPNGQQKGSVTIGGFVVENDAFLQFTGYSGINGYLLKGRDNTTDNYSFYSGYLNSYNCKCSIGEIPSFNAGIDVFGNMGKLVASDDTQVSTDFTAIGAGSTSFNYRIPSYGSMILNLDDFTTNRVLSYEIGLKIPRNPIYPLSRQFPNVVEINWPIEVRTSFSFVKNDYTTRKQADYPSNPKNKNIILTLKNHQNDNNILSFNFSGMVLEGESYEIDTNGNVTVNANYLGYLARPK